MMEESLEKLDGWLKTHRPGYYENLQAPWTEEQFARIQALAGTALPDSYKALYGWKGGQSALADENLYEDWRFLQFEEARIAYQTYNELYEMGEFKMENWWNPKWVPFLENESAILLCVDIAGSFGGESGQLVTFSPESPARTIEFPDLATFITSLQRGYEEAASANTLTTEIRIPYPPGYPVQAKAG
jgi:cell wall assembly regulator SMI1